MAAVDHVLLAKINYWCREKHYRHMQNVAIEGVKRFGNDPILKFFNAFSMILEDRVQEGMRELQLLKDRQDVNLCSLLCLIYGHRKARVIDREAVQELESSLRSERKSSGEKGLYYAGLFLVQTGKHEKAKEYITRCIQTNPHYKEALALRGWIELQTDPKKAIKYFEEALQQEGHKDIDAMFGKAKHFEMRRNYNAALEMCNTLVVTLPNFIPGLIEKMKLTLALQDWDQVVETAQRALNMEADCPEAHRYMILYMLSREGNYQDAAQMIGDLLQELDRVEPKNPYLYHQYAKVFSRICGRSAEVLQQTYYMQERAVSLESNNAEYVIELGYEELMRRKVKEAHKCFQNGMRLNESSVEALTGVIRCQILEGMYDDAEQQLEFLREVQQGNSLSPELTFASAELAIKRQQAPEKIISLLNEASTSHFAKLKGVPLSMDYFYGLDPDFITQISTAYLEFAPQQPPTPGQPPNEILQKCSQVLEPVARVLPGLMEVLFLIAKIKYLSGDIDSAQSSLQHCLTQDSSYSDAHILMAQIYLYQSNFKMANQSLETGLSYNFQVREHPLYHLIKARILKKQGDTEEAVRTLQVAMSLPGVTTTGGSSSAAPGKKRIQISTNDRVSVFLELVDAYLAQDSQHEAAKVMQDALNEFQGTPEEIRITIANADLAIGRGDVEGALAQLRSISPEQPYFVQAREKMAEIYLHHRKDRRLYAGCYRELFDRCPNQHTSLLLGDAYMAIQEPDRAIEVYEAALKKNPRDYSLASKIGQAYVKTHHYGKAINYYEAAIKSGGKGILRHDLGALLVKMRQFDKAEKILKQALEIDGNSSELETMIDVTRYYILMAEVYERRNKPTESVLYLTKAKDSQQRVLKRVSVEQPDLHAQQKQLAASICTKMATHALTVRDYEKAVKCYKEALIHSENDGKIQLELANIYLMKEDLDSCQHQCMMLLKEDKENDAATVMMADLMFRKNDYENAMYHFQQLLERKPDHYEAMARLVDLMRRAGKLEEVPRFFELAEKKSSRTVLDSGFNYCKGLYEWYGGNASSALGYFNKARKDSQFGMKAMYNMIEICLNPDSDTLGGEVFESMEGDLGISSNEGGGLSGHIRTAETLLREIKPKAQTYRTQLLENMLIVTTKDRMGIEKALQNFADLANEREDVGCMYGMAVAFMVLKQTPRARNHLKRVAKNTWNMEDAEYLEKCWLLLADIYIQGAKYDLATELLNKCLEHNKSCCKAYEYLGFIMEKEQSYKDAARNYENAWKYGNKSNPNIGFKLAFNYLKAKRYIDAIEICHNVLNLQPDYPKIRKEVMDKARACIRV